MDIADTLSYDGDAVAAEVLRPSEVVIEDDNPEEAQICQEMPEGPADDSAVPESSHDTPAAVEPAVDESAMPESSQVVPALVEPADDSAMPESSQVVPAVVATEAAADSTVPESSDITPALVEPPLRQEAHGSEDAVGSSAVECVAAAVVTEDAQGSKDVGQPATEADEGRVDGLASMKLRKERVVVSKQNQDAKQKELKEQTEQEKESKKAKKAAAKEAKMAAKAAKEAKKKAEQAKPKRRPGRPCKNESKAMSSSGAAGSAVPAVPLHDVEEPAPAPKCKASKKKESAKKPKQPDDQVEACPKPKAKAKAKGKSGKRGLPATEHADPIAPAAEHAVEPIPMAPQAALEEQDRPIAPAAGGAPPAVEAVREEKRRRIGCARKKHPELANLPLFEYVELSVYWTRVGVGIKLKDEKKQIFYVSNKRLSMQHNIDFAISMAEIVEVSMGDYKGVADILEQKKNIFMGNR
ncbi:unnamed protein product [Symbiodinium microadriaticum]|nr:unnamed protein product [Symbiodinium microadriaticum]